MNLFDIVFRPDKEEMSQKADIAQAANLLEIGEFQLLQLAYREWFGHDLPDEQINQVFAVYIASQEAPDWAIRYARHIIELDARERLDKNRPHYHRYDSNYRVRVPQGRRQFIMAALFCGLVIFGGVALASLIAASPTSILPPYFEPSELVQQR